MNILTILRTNLGLSQVALTTKIRCSRWLISFLETGRSVPTYNEAKAIATALGTTVDNLTHPATLILYDGSQIKIPSILDSDVLRKDDSDLEPSSQAV